jgi:hypothetical protein
MSPSRLEPPSPEVEELLTNERQFPPQPAERRMRALQRARKVAFQTSAQRRSIFGRSASLLLAAAPVLTFAALSLAAFYGWRAFATRPSEAPTGNGQTNPPPAPRALTAPPSALPPISEAPSSLEDVPLPLDSSNTVGKRRSPPAVDAEAAELRLLQRARAAVARGEFETALAHIADYQRRFPAGNLREECEALRVKSLTELGRNDQARRAAEGFREQFPRSVLRRRIEETAKPPR